jgi:hypothetical protein
MPPKKTLTAKNLEALGVERLAELLIEIGDTNAAVKRRLRLELAGAQSPAEVAREIRKRLKVIARARSFVDWQNRRGLVEDLQTQRRVIVDHVGKTDPKEALDLMWGFMALASSVFARCDDSSGTVIDIFHEAVNDLGRLAEIAKGDTTELADRAFQALLANDYGQFDHLIPILGAALGDAGLEHLKQRFIALSKEPVKKTGRARAAEDRLVDGRSNLRRRSRRSSPRPCHRHRIEGHCRRAGRRRRLHRAI